jgi:hypothetical protein
MNNTKPTTYLHRRAFLTGIGLTTLASSVFASPVQNTLRAAPNVRTNGMVQVAICGTGNAFQGVTTHFRLHDGTSIPFYAWSGGESTIRFTMPLTSEGLRLTIESVGETSQDIALGKVGPYLFTHPDGESQLCITITPIAV